MSVAEDVVALLVTAGVGTANTDLFVGFMPETPADVTVVYEYSGAAPRDVLGASSVLEMPRIQVVCRSGSYQTGRARSKTAWDALGAVANQTISGTRYLRIRLLQSPFMMGRDENSNPLIVFNCEVTKVPS